MAALAFVFCLSYLLGAKSSTGDESFAGSDSVATAAAEEHGAKPWFGPLFQPGSSEIESGLFALQAAIGGCILGFALGRLGARNGNEAKSAGADVEA